MSSCETMGIKRQDCRSSSPFGPLSVRLGTAAESASGDTGSEDKNMRALHQNAHKTWASESTVYLHALK